MGNRSRASRVLSFGAMAVVGVMVVGELFDLDTPPLPEVLKIPPVEAARHQQPELSALEIFDRTAAVYRDARSYEDEGVVRMVFKGGHTSQLFFNTAFERSSGSFRFEYVEPRTSWSASRLLKGDKRKVIWGTIENTNSWWTIGDRLEQGEELALLLAGATGVSGGSAHTIPRMLLPEQMKGWTFQKLADAQVAGVDTVQGRTCYRIVGRDSNTDELRVWIDCETFLLLRMQEFGESPDVEIVTAYQPKLNEPVDPARFEFDPPQ